MANKQEVAVRQGNQVADWTQDQEKVGLLKRAFMDKETTDDELKIAVMTCSSTGLNPFSRQVYFVRRKGKMVTQTGIDGFRLVAQRTGVYGGQDDYLFDEGLNLYQHLETKRGNPVTATVTVYKITNGVRCAYTASANWEQYFPGEAQGFMWKKMPHLMLGKCCEALALRKAFPAELSGLYTNDEMQQADKNTHLGERVPFEDQMAKEKERIAKKELKDAGVIKEAEIVPDKVTTLPEGEKQQGDPLPATEGTETTPETMTELQKQDNMVQMGTQMYPDSADCANYFIKSSEYFHKEEGKPDKLVKGKDNPYNLKAGRLLNTYKRIKKDYDDYLKNKEAE